MHKPSAKLTINLLTTRDERNHWIRVSFKGKATLVLHLPILAVSLHLVHQHRRRPGPAGPRASRPPPLYMLCLPPRSSCSPLAKKKGKAKPKDITTSPLPRRRSPTLSHVERVTGGGRLLLVPHAGRRATPAAPPARRRVRPAPHQISKPVILLFIDSKYLKNKKICKKTRMNSEQTGEDIF
jgi:hypothetical protein